MEHCPPWKSTSPWASQEIPHIWWNLKVHYRSHNTPPPAPILNQINIILAPTNFLNIPCNIILPSTPGSAKWTLPLKSAHQNPIPTSPLPPYVSHAIPISCFLIWSPGYCLFVCLFRSTNHKQRILCFINACLLPALAPTVRIPNARLSGHPWNRLETRESLFGILEPKINVRMHMAMSRWRSVQTLTEMWKILSLTFVNKNIKWAGRS